MQFRLVDTQRGRLRRFQRGGEDGAHYYFGDGWKKGMLDLSLEQIHFRLAPEDFATAHPQLVCLLQN